MLASTCKLYAFGLKREVRRAMAVVVRPRESVLLWSCFVLSQPTLSASVAADFSSCRWCRMPELVSDDSDDDSMPELVEIAAVVTEHQSRVAVHTHGISLPLWWRHV